MKDEMAPSRAEIAIARANNRDPGNRFVASCRRFWQERGYLSAKQIEALDRVTPTRRGPDLAGPPISWSASEDEIEDDDLANSQYWDWAGGE